MILSSYSFWVTSQRDTTFTPLALFRSMSLLDINKTLPFFKVLLKHLKLAVLLRISSEDVLHSLNLVVLCVLFLSAAVFMVHIMS